MTVPHPDRISPNSARKGRRLHREGKVTFVGLVPLYLVEGDHDTYPVIVRDDAMHCFCPHHGACAHDAGVLEHRKADPDPPRFVAAARPTDAFRQAAENADRTEAMAKAMERGRRD